MSRVGARDHRLPRPPLLPQVEGWVEGVTCLFRVRWRTKLWQREAEFPPNTESAPSNRAKTNFCPALRKVGSS